MNQITFQWHKNQHMRTHAHTRKSKPCMIMGEDFKLQTSLNMLHPPVFRILLCKSEPYKVDMNFNPPPPHPPHHKKRNLLDLATTTIACSLLTCMLHLEDTWTCSDDEIKSDLMIQYTASGLSSEQVICISYAEIKDDIMVQSSGIRSWCNDVVITQFTRGGISWQATSRSSRAEFIWGVGENKSHRKRWPLKSSIDSWQRHQPTATLY